MGHGHSRGARKAYSTRWRISASCVEHLSGRGEGPPHGRLCIADVGGVHVAAGQGQERRPFTGRHSGFHCGGTVRQR